MAHNGHGGSRTPAPLATTPLATRTRRTAMCSSQSMRIVVSNVCSSGVGSYSPPGLSVAFCERHTRATYSFTSNGDCADMDEGGRGGGGKDGANTAHRELVAVEHARRGRHRATNGERTVLFLAVICNYHNS